MTTDPTPLADPDPLADAARRLLAAIRLTAVDDSTRRAAAATIAGAAEALEAIQVTGRLCETGLDETNSTDPRTSADPLGIFPFSPAVGARNPQAPRVEMTLDADGHIRGTATFAPLHNGPPWNVVHGGMIALLHDEILGMVGIATGVGGFTGRLTINYRRPAPLLEPIEFHSWVDRVEGRKTFVRAELHHDGHLLNESEGLFIRPALDGPLAS